MAQCCRTKRNGERCKNKAIPGKKTCRAHGGLGGGRPRKPDSEVDPKYLKSFKRYQYFIRAAAAKERFEDVMADPSLMSLRSSYGVAEVMKLGALEAVFDPDTNTAEWNRAAVLFQEMTQALNDLDDAAYKAAHEDLGKVLSGGVKSERAKGEFFGLTEMQARWMQAEQKVMVTRDNYIDPRMFMAFIGWLCELLQSRLRNSEDVEFIVAQIDAKLNEGSAQQTLQTRNGT